MTAAQRTAGDELLVILIGQLQLIDSLINNARGDTTELDAIADQIDKEIAEHKCKTVSGIVWKLLECDRILKLDSGSKKISELMQSAISDLVDLEVGEAANGR